MIPNVAQMLNEVSKIYVLHIFDNGIILKIYNLNMILNDEYIAITILSSIKDKYNLISGYICMIKLMLEY